MLLDKANIKYQLINVEDEQGKLLALKYDIRKAPTLLIPDGQHYQLYDNASKIKGFIEAQA